MTASALLTGRPVLIFDLDGTLVDTAPMHARAFADIFSDIGITGFDYTRHAGRRTDDVVRDVLTANDRGDANIDQIVRGKQERAVELIAGSPGLLPGAGEFLSWANSGGRRMALATSASRAGTAASLRVNGIGEYFEIVVTGDDVQSAKPAPDIYRTALAAIGCGASDCVVFEDSEAGYRAARAAGLDVIVIVRGDPESPPPWVPAGTPLESFARLLEAVKSDVR